MEEVNILSQKDKSLLLEKLEKECALLIPQDKDRLGELQFHLFKYKGQNGNGKPQDYFFQIRMGIHQIFSKKHLPFCEKGDCIAKLESIIAANKKQIKNSIIDYCQNQLDTVLTVELEPEFNKHGLETERVVVPEDKVKQMPWDLHGERVNLVASSGAVVQAFLEVVEKEKSKRPT